MSLQEMKNRRQRTILFCACLLFAFILGGCGQDTGSPEEKIKEDLAKLEQAAEARELAPLRKSILDEYSDNEGFNKKSIIQFIQLNFIRQQSIHLLTRIKSVEVSDTNNAIVDVLVAMAGRPLDDVGTLMGISADLFRFEVNLKKQGDDWKVAKANWRRATPDEFL